LYNSVLVTKIILGLLFIYSRISLYICRGSWQIRLVTL